MKLMQASLTVLVSAGMTMAGTIPTVSGLTSDTLGAHLLYGRGCVGCHAPHSGVRGNGKATTADTATGNVALWGQDLQPYYGTTLGFGDAGKYSVTLPTSMATVSISDGGSIVLLCLSCHDGNTATVAMMTGKTVETLPIVGGNAPTLLGNDGTTAGNYNNDHPVGTSAVFGCGGTYNWDCTLAANSNSPTAGAGSGFASFLTNYGFAVKLYTTGTTYATVTCTSCHNQHSETVYNGKMNGSSTPANYATMFFLRGYYQPATGGNNAAQFCRQCHGGNSNEMLGQLNVPTT